MNRQFFVIILYTQVMDSYVQQIPNSNLSFTKKSFFREIPLFIELLSSHSTCQNEVCAVRY